MSVADPPSAWGAIGFAVDGRAVPIGPVTVWTGDVADRPGWDFGVPMDGAIDGVPVRPHRRNLPSAEHPNGVIGVDHVVVLSPAVGRTSAALEAAGFPLRRVRELDDGAREQRFFWAGSTVVELAGPVAPEGDGPAQLWGLALVSADLDRTVTCLEGRISPPRAAVQPGRRIATIATRAAGISLALAVMSPH